MNEPTKVPCKWCGEETTATALGECAGCWEIRSRSEGNPALALKIMQGIGIIEDTKSLDITAPEHGVEVTVREDATVIWVNIDGICVLRVCQIPRLMVQVPTRFPRLNVRAEKKDVQYLYVEGLEK